MRVQESPRVFLYLFKCDRCNGFYSSYNIGLFFVGGDIITLSCEVKASSIIVVIVVIVLVVRGTVANPVTYTIFVIVVERTADNEIAIMKLIIVE